MPKVPGYKQPNKLELARIKAAKEKRFIKNESTPIKLYTLKLEDNCYYIGTTFNIEKRFKKHLKGNNAVWTRLHKPIEIVEIRVTKSFDQKEVIKLEDDMTIEYAMKYGKDFVRGGSYCTMNPYWPDIIIQNELNYK